MYQLLCQHGYAGKDFVLSVQCKAVDDVGVHKIYGLASFRFMQ